MKPLHISSSRTRGKALVGEGESAYRQPSGYTMCAMYYRYHDVEATLKLGIRRRAYPLGKLNRILQGYKSTGSLHFDANQHTLNSYQVDQHEDVHTVHVLVVPDVHQPLRCHLNWINLKLQHTHAQMSFVDAPSTILLQKEAAVFPHSSNKVIPVQEKEDKPNDHQQVVQLPHNPGFIAHQLMLSGVLDRETYHFLNTSSWFHGKASNKLVLKEPIVLDKDSFHVVRQLGQGGLANVYLVQHAETAAYYGLKVQQPAHPWEYYILCQIHSRKSTDINVLDAYAFYHYSDASFLLMQLIRHGTLLDALNLYRPSKAYMPESVVVVIIAHLLQELIKLHHIHIVHNDLKLDNIMLVSSSSSQRNAAEFPRIMMIDLVIPSTSCQANWAPACARSDFPKLNQPHPPYHADYWQLAAMAHLLLYGTLMLTSRTRDGHYSILQPIRRYWHKDLWTAFFDILLNPTLDSEHVKLQDLLHQFQQASQHLPQHEISSFVSMLQDKVFAKQ
ncbi:kinase-like domain-containing protein [Mucor lusitanicus]